MKPPTTRTFSESRALQTLIWEDGGLRMTGCLAIPTQQEAWMDQVRLNGLFICRRTPLHQDRIPEDFLMLMT